MVEVPALIGPQRAAAGGVLGPAEDARLEESAVDDQLTTAFEQVEQVYLTLGPFELVHLLHRHPRHPSTLGGQRITRTSQGFLLHEETLARCLPFLLRHDWRCVYSEMSVAVLHVFRFVPVHVSLLFLISPGAPLPLVPLRSDAGGRTSRPHSCSGNGRYTPPHA